MSDWRSIPKEHWKRGNIVAFDVVRGKVVVMGVGRTLAELPPGYIYHTFDKDADPPPSFWRRMFGGQKQIAGPN